MKRLTAVLLLLSLLLGASAGCAENKKTDENPSSAATDAAAAENTAIETEPETELTDGLPDTDMQGFEIHILHHSQEWLA